MALASGSRFGVYEVQSLLGRGGMGEVYRAHDPRLGRGVALKILPERLADAERLARFRREAQALAALNHPHIAAIYGLEAVDGRHALVLELVEGLTLAERIATAPIPLVEVQTVARQIADALDAAHEKGIVHRDLKPANIKITPEGAAKVLDFGLAKITNPQEPVDPSESPTMSVGGTGSGVLLGTAAYMSPEQARGRPVDKRADIWAFGCLLYEMRTGRAAFAGESASDILVAVLEREPDWSHLTGRAPASIERLIRRCLEKDLKKRLRDIGDARVELEAGGAPAADAWPARVPNRPMWALVALAVAGAAAAFAVGRNTASRPESAAVTPPTFTRLTFRDGFIWSARFAPDGRTVVYSASWHGRCRCRLS